MRRRDILFAGTCVVGSVTAALAGVASWNRSSGQGESGSAMGGVEPAHFAASDLRLPTGARVLLIGDSIFAGATYGISSESNFTLTHSTTGELVWAYMQDPRFSFEVWERSDSRGSQGLLWDGDNQGIGGTSATRLEEPSELAHVRRLDPDVVIVGFGANDIALGSSAAHFCNSIKSFCDQMILVDGRRVIVALVRPHVVRGASNDFYNYPVDSSRWDVHFQINDYIANELGSGYSPQSLLIWDTFTPLADPTSYRGAEFVPSFTRDGVHLTDAGAFHSARRLMPVLASLIRPGLWFDHDADRLNLLPNGRMSGSFNRLSPGVSGQVPEQWEVFRSIGENATVVTSLEPDTEFGGDELVLNINIDNVAGVEEFTIMFHAGNYIPLANSSGKFVQLFVPIKIDAYSNFISVTSFLSDDVSMRECEGLRSVDGPSSIWHGEAVSGWIITPRLELQKGALGVRCGLRVRMDGGGTGTCRLAIRPNVIARVVEDPRDRAVRRGLL